MSIEKVCTYFVTFATPNNVFTGLDEETLGNDLRAATLYRQVDIEGTRVKLKWCQTCAFYRPPRCSHCWFFLNVRKPCKSKFRSFQVLFVITVLNGLIITARGLIIALEG